VVVGLHPDTALAVSVQPFQIVSTIQTALMRVAAFVFYAAAPTMNAGCKKQSRQNDLKEKGFKMDKAKLQPTELGAIEKARLKAEDLYRTGQFLSVFGGRLSGCQ
jgi:hypothetical protein